MKLNFKDLKQQKFTLDAEPTDTVVDVKKKVADEKGFEAGSIRLIWSGKILQDDKTIDSYDIQPNDQIVCMVQKPKAAPVTTKAAPSTPAPAAPSTPSAPPPAPAQSSTSTTANAPATPSPAPATAAAATEQPERPAADPNMMMGAERQAAIANMESMGFERAQIERAMRAAFYHPDRAVEYLLNGIPENLQQQERAPAAPAAAAATSPPVAPAAAATTGSRTAAPAPAEAETTTAETGGADEPVNLFEAAAAAYQGGRGGAGAGAGRGTATGIAGGGGGGIPAAGETANLDFLRNNEAFQQMRQAVQQNPAMLEQLLQQVAASNPALASMIASNPAQFIQLLSEGQPDDNAQNVVSVTEEERDAIERLCRLGFERDLVIQAYFACDKNEELAANFLFDQPDDDQPGDS